MNGSIKLQNFLPYHKEYAYTYAAIKICILQLCIKMELTRENKLDVKNSIKRQLSCLKY